MSDNSRSLNGRGTERVINESIQEELELGIDGLVGSRESCLNPVRCCCKACCYCCICMKNSEIGTDWLDDEKFEWQDESEFDDEIVVEILLQAVGISLVLGTLVGLALGRKLK